MGESVQEMDTTTERGALMMDEKLVDLLVRGYGMHRELVERATHALERTNRVSAKIDSVVAYNQAKVLEAFHHARVSENCLFGSTGYGYGDAGREKLDTLYARVFRAEAALVRSQFVSGTHAIACALNAACHDSKVLICATGTPYDSLLPVLGLSQPEPKVAATNVRVLVVPLDDTANMNVSRIVELCREHRASVFVQRSCGYEWRPSQSVANIEWLIREIRAHSPDTRVVVDNCYGEFVEDVEPIEAGADLVAGSLIKNPGGGLCASGGYIVGRRRLVELAAERLTCPGIGAHVGSNPLGLRHLFQGFFMAPSIVGQSLKGAVFAARFFAELGFSVMPEYAEPRTDIIQGISLGTPERVLSFCRGIQKGSAVDSFVRPVAGDLPGYEQQVVMAGGTFIQGSSIELSADAPMREPYAVYLQGGLSSQHAILGSLFAAHELMKLGHMPALLVDLPDSGKNRT